jgi:hypothetical protein
MRLGNILAAFLCVPAFAVAGMAHRILVDEPGILETEITLDGAHPVRVDAAGAMRVECAGCGAETDPGAPDLPSFAFTMLTGPSEPRASIEVLESESVAVPEGIAPLGEYVSLSRKSYRPDPALYRRSEVPVARIGPVRYLSGLPVRILRIPMAAWSESRKTLTLLKRVRVRALSGGCNGNAVAAMLRHPVSGQVLNPIGGACWAGRFQGRAAAGKRSAAHAGISASFLGDTLIRVRIGDRSLENLDEDKVYAMRFGDAASVAPTLQAVPIRNLRLYAGPYDSLPRNIASAAPSPGNLEEVPIEIRDANGNGTFDEGDSLVFYGHGTSLWKRIPGATGPIRYAFVSDPYSFENFYYLDFSGKAPGAPERLAVPPSIPSSSPARTDSYHYVRAEKDAKTAACEPGGNPWKEDPATGFIWFWHRNGSCSEASGPVTLARSMLASLETEFLRSPARGDGDSLYVGLFAYPYSAEDDFRIWLGRAREPLPHLPLPGIQGNWYVTTAPLAGDGALGIDSLRWGGADSRFDGYTVAYKRRLTLDDALWIFPRETGRRESYRVEGGDGAFCLRLESGVPSARFELDAGGGFTDSLGPDADARYLVYRKPVLLPKAAMEPELPPSAGRGIRDLESGDGKHPSYLILATRALADQALALKRYRNDPKRAFRPGTEVVLIEDIYRHYSGGRLSPPAIRDFLRWAYYRWGGGASGPGPLRYVSLFGDGHYDYRNIAVSSKGKAATNHIPPYEFLDGIEGMASEDFYALLDSGDRIGDKSPLELAVGRIPAKTPAEAEAYLAKVAAYEDPSKTGAWRGRMLFAADDGTQRGAPWDFDPIYQGHTTVSDSLIKAITAKEPGVTADRVYLLDYPMNSAFHKPEATQDLLSLINQGTLLVNFVGHGAYNQWADEVLLQSNNALSRMRNEGRTPFINAFSCTVGRFDDFERESMSAQFVMAANRGAIGSVSAMRESYPNENIELAESFYGRAFPPEGAPDPAPIGDAFRDAKNDPRVSAGNMNSSRYALLGEPVLLLRKPQIRVALSRAPDTLKALDCDSIAGTVEGGSGSGWVNVKILAGSTQKSWPPPPGSSIRTQYAEQRGAILFERTFAYGGGRFTTDYFIPRQIAFGDTNARIQVFVWDGTQEREGSAAKTGLVIHGQSDGRCAVDSDGKGPEIRITGCDTKESGSVGFADQVKLPLPACLEIQVTDNAGGVSSAEGPDEGTTLEIPGSIEPFHPHPGIDELNRKVFLFSIQKSQVAPGPHLLKVSARDGYGNYSARVLRMTLTNDSAGEMISAYNIPNPMKRNGTTFHFSTLLPAQEVDYDDPASGGARLEFEIRIYNQSGRLVKRIPNAQSGSATWDGRDGWGNLQANGPYFYTVTARRLDGGADPDPSRPRSSSKRNILVISR